MIDCETTGCNRNLSQCCVQEKPVEIKPNEANRQCKHRIQLRALRKKMTIAHEKLTDFDALKEENEFLKNRNKELVSLLDIFMSHHGLVQSSTESNLHPKNPYTCILALEDKVRALQLELGLFLAKGDCTPYYVHKNTSETTDFNNLQEKIQTNTSSSTTQNTKYLVEPSVKSLNKDSLESHDTVKFNTAKLEEPLQMNEKNSHSHISELEALPFCSKLKVDPSPSKECCDFGLSHGNKAFNYFKSKSMELLNMRRGNRSESNFHESIFLSMPLFSSVTSNERSPKNAAWDFIGMN